ncbi:MAG: FTR1 family protein [Actinomycetota bacterium]|nr:FTR1 family protein [Actinomycetota bacterium]
MLAPFLIMLREGFEAALVIAILYAYLQRTGRRDLLGPMWVGVGAAFAIAGAFGIALHVGIGSLEGDARARAFAAVMLFAVVVLTWMIFWMRAHAMKIRGELQTSMEHAIHGAGNVKVAVVAAAFLAVLREGFEAAVFLLALSTGGDSWGLFVGAVLGLGLSAVLGWMVVIGGKRLPMRQFFKVTGVVLILFAAGLLSRAVGGLQLIGDLPLYYDAVYNLTMFPWLTGETEVGNFLIAIAGWDPRPSIEQVIVWSGYTGVVTWLFLRKPRTARPQQQRASVPEPH